MEGLLLLPLLPLLLLETDRDLSLYLNQTASYKLHLIYPEGGAYLSQPSATINSTNYFPRRFNTS